MDQKSGIIAYEVEGGNITFDTSKGSITSADKTIMAVVIPATIDGYKVNSIDNDAFAGCTMLKSVVIQEGLTSIGYAAFKNCSGLERVEIPKTVKTTGVNGSAVGIWFSGCTGLKEIVLEEGMETIPPGAFAEIPVKIKLELPDSIKAIGSYAFVKSQVTKVLPKDSSSEEAIGVVRLPKGMKEIGYDVLVSCTILEEVIWPTEYEAIPQSSFKYCTSLRTLVLPVGLKEIRNYAFEGCTGLKELNLPQGMVKVGYAAFLNCTGLERVEVPKSVKETGLYGSAVGIWFSGCKGLKEIVLEEGMETIPPGAFAEIPVKIKLELPDSIKTIGNYAFVKSQITKVISKDSSSEGEPGVMRLPKGIKEIGYDVFVNCKVLEEVIWPTEYEAIPQSSFKYCTSLRTLVLPVGLKEIRNYAFEGCTGLKELNLPQGMVKVGYAAFINCTGLERVEVPKSVKEAGLYGSAVGIWFSGCKGLKEIVLEEGMETIPPGAFAEIPVKIKLELPDSIKTIGNYAFVKSQITKVISKDSSSEGEPGVMRLPKGMKEIGYDVFVNCKVLEEVIWPTEYEAIPQSSFKYCTSLRTLVLPVGLKETRNYAFEGCTGLKELNLPQGMVKVGYAAFLNCTGLERVEIPKSVNETGLYGSAVGIWFSGCKGLKEIVLEEGMTTIPPGAFAEINAKIKIELPDSIKTIGNYAFVKSQVTKVLPKDSSSAAEPGVVRLPEGMEEIGYDVFVNCKALEEIVWPKEYEVIPQSSFKYCTSLRTLVFSEGLKKIHGFAFEGCTALKEVILPQGLVSIGYTAFINCTSLAYVKIPKSVNATGKYGNAQGLWFMGCNSLKRIELEEGMEQIPVSSFAELQTDFEINIPESLVTIADRAFYNCRNLTKIHLNTNILYIGKDVFKGCDKLTISFPMNYILVNYVIENDLKHVVVDCGTADCGR